MRLEYPHGTTPLDADELEGLIPEHVTVRAELNELEQANIVRAVEWLSRIAIKTITDEAFLRRLHEAMFGDVWRWAGVFRATGKSIGVAPHQIAPSLRDLCRDVDAWIERSSFPADEIGARFHHRLVSIDLFPNGNGRHARLAADLLLERRLGRPRFTWGSASLDNTGDARSSYIAALRAADALDYHPLFDFVRR